jgi:hypothetical protein
MNSTGRWFVYGVVGILLGLAAIMFQLGQHAPDELFLQMQKALGGAEKIAAIRDFDQLSEAETFDPNGAPVRVQKRVRWVKPNHLRVDQVGRFDTYVLYFDGTSGWEILPDGAMTDLKDGELEFARKYLANFQVRLWLADRLPGYTITSRSANEIHISFQDDPGKQVAFTLDPVSFLPVKDASISLGNPDQPMPIEHEFRQWTTVQNVRFPKELWIIQDGRRLGIIRTQRIDLNTGINPQELSIRPADHKPVLRRP